MGQVVATARAGSDGGGGSRRGKGGEGRKWGLTGNVGAGSGGRKAGSYLQTS